MEGLEGMALRLYFDVQNYCGFVYWSAFECYWEALVPDLVGIQWLSSARALAQFPDNK